MVVPPWLWNRSHGHKRFSYQSMTACFKETCLKWFWLATRRVRSHTSPMQLHFSAEYFLVSWRTRRCKHSSVLVRDHVQLNKIIFIWFLRMVYILHMHCWNQEQHFNSSAKNDQILIMFQPTNLWLHIIYK